MRLSWRFATVSMASTMKESLFVGCLGTPMHALQPVTTSGRGLPEGSRGRGDCPSRNHKVGRVKFSSGPILVVGQPWHTSSGRH
jgi:hypothetical protein